MTSPQVGAAPGLAGLLPGDPGPQRGDRRGGTELARGRQPEGLPGGIPHVFHVALRDRVVLDRRRAVLHLPPIEAGPHGAVFTVDGVECRRSQQDGQSGQPCRDVGGEVTNDPLHIFEVQVLQRAQGAVGSSEFEVREFEHGADHRGLLARVRVTGRIHVDHGRGRAAERSTVCVRPVAMTSRWTVAGALGRTRGWGGGFPETLPFPVRSGTVISRFRRVVGASAMLCSRSGFRMLSRRDGDTR